MRSHAIKSIKRIIFIGKPIYTGVLHSHEVYNINIKQDTQEKINNRRTTLILMLHEYLQICFVSTALIGFINT